MKLFFLIDPLVLVATWLAAHGAPAVLLWSLALVVVTVAPGPGLLRLGLPAGHHPRPRRTGSSTGRRQRARHRDHWSRWQRPSITCWPACW